jgi:S-adenosylmethionine-diacylglycerol 3-amino-3-carboxypropyl transferase
MTVAEPATAPPRSAGPLPYGGRLMFTQSWEDPACDREALRPAPGSTIFAITSGGDNVLGSLLDDPGRIITVDLNPAQGWLLELKREAIRRLGHGELLELLGVRPPARARQLYGSVRQGMSDPARTFWDRRPDWFDRGLLTRGGFERYFALLRRTLRVVVGTRRLERLFTLPPEEQPEYFRREWDTWSWRAFVRVGCSKAVLGNRLDPSWFRQAGSVGSFGAHFERLAVHAIGELPARTNYFLAQILLGRYLDEQQVPDYLRPEHFGTLRERLDRLDPMTADVGDALAALPDGSVDCFALSNVFEYSPPELFQRSLAEIRRVARPNARVALRNLLAPRRLEGHPGFAVDTRLGERLGRADRGFIYSRFEAATVRPDET